MDWFVVIGVVLAIAAIIVLAMVLIIARQEHVARRNYEIARRAFDSQAAHVSFPRIQARLDTANVSMSASMFVTLLVAFTVVGAAFAGTLLGPLAALAVIAIVLLVATIVTRSNEKSSRNKFEEQLSISLPMIASNMQAGQNFENAVKIVSENMEEPLRGQFDIVLFERRMGTPLEEALQNMAERMQSRDARMLATVVAVQAVTGGSMADVLLSISDTMQRRSRMKKHVAAVTADGRMSAAIIGGIPVVVFLMLNITTPGYLEPMFTTPIGIGAMVLAVTLAVTGLMLIRKMYRVEIY